MVEPPPSDWAERLGMRLGERLAPWFAKMAAARRGRALHPTGEVYLARVLPLAKHSDLRRLADGLGDRALVRLSAALWKDGRPWPEVLGCAVRFSAWPEAVGAPLPDDQDLLLATVWRPWTLPLAPLLTWGQDYLDQRYHGVARFFAAGLGPARLRVLAHRGRAIGPNRSERLRRDVEAGEAVLELQIRAAGRGWQPLVALQLRSVPAFDTARLAYSPYRCGRGLVPRGFVHGLRWAVYPAAQAPRAQLVERKTPTPQQEIGQRPPPWTPGRTPDVSVPR